MVSRGWPTAHIGTSYSVSGAWTADFADFSTLLIRAMAAPSIEIAHLNSIYGQRSFRLWKYAPLHCAPGYPHSDKISNAA